jgi:putative transcriptional regulator
MSKNFPRMNRSTRHFGVAFILCAAVLLLGTWLLGPSQPVTASESKPAAPGTLLVATESMQDPRFVEAVIYLVKHDAEGTLGLVINKPLAQASINDLLEGFGSSVRGAERNITVHYGGPVSTRQGFFLHSDDVTLEGTIKNSNGIAMTSNTRLIEAVALGKGPRQFLMTLGYAGWAPGQLEGEILANSWVIVSSDNGLVFGTDAEKKWRRAMDKRQIPL